MKTRHTSKWFWLILFVVFLGVPFVAPSVLADVVTGQVVDCHGNAVDGATVALFKVEGTNETRQAIDTTNGNGVFQFQANKGTYNVLVVCPGGSSSHSVNFSIPGSAAGMLRLVCDCPKTSAKATTTSVGGLKKISFDTSSGEITVSLPNDMRARDTISGTVIADPKGQAPNERAKNQGELQGYVVAIFPDPKPPKSPPIAIFDLSLSATPQATFTVPKKVNVSLFLMPNESSPIGGCGRSGGLVAINEGCSPISQLVFTSPDAGIVVTPKPTAPSIFTIPTLGQTGRTIEITGPFDGNSANTGVTFQPLDPSAALPTRTIPVIAESPRKVVVAVPPDVTGPTQIQVNENGSQSTGTCNNLGVNLTAPKTSLLKGESTELHVEVNGLQGITKPVPLTLESHGVITMVGGMYQQLMIQPSEVGTDGRYTTTRGVTGVQAGAWSTTATVVTQPFNVCLQDDSTREFVLVWNTFTGDYAFNCPDCLPSKTDGGTTVAAAGTSGLIFPSLFSVIGYGTNTRKGCVITLTDNRTDRGVMATLDTCTQEGSASVRAGKAQFVIRDRNIADNTCPGQ